MNLRVLVMSLMVIVLVGCRQGDKLDEQTLAELKVDAAAATELSEELERTGLVPIDENWSAEKKRTGVLLGGFCDDLLSQCSAAMTSCSSCQFSCPIVVTACRECLSKCRGARRICDTAIKCQRTWGQISEIQF